LERKVCGAFDLQLAKYLVNILDMDAKATLKEIVRLANSLLEELECDEPKLPEEALELNKKGLCLVCKRKLDGVVSRMDHEACYRQIMRMIKSGKITERQAIEAGLMAPEAQAGRKRKSSIEDEIEARVLAAKALQEIAARKKS
jgi:hypothetical protein